MWRRVTSNPIDRVDFANPILGDRWLSLLSTDEHCGLRFRESLDLDSSYLGFTFKSNRQGFRGVESTKASTVILGTSFAMGLSVDEGENWYQLAFEPGKVANYAMPVSPANHLGALYKNYEGSFKDLIYLYHPNVWKTSVGFYESEKQKLDIKTIMGWDKSSGNTRLRTSKWVSREIVKAITGRSLYLDWNGLPFYFDAKYNFFDRSKYKAVEMYVLQGFRDLFALFDRVLVVRVPIKEELFEPNNITALADLRENYDLMWRLFCDEFSNQCDIRYPDLGLSHEDYHPYDTHWTALGNQKVASYFGNLKIGA